tara:strand:+ start:1080 stop:1811 length:732 start_codon:yes stop_codon:yes gene_type:complete
MPKYTVLIAAAGHGHRSGLPYPKTLYPIKGKPILIHLLNLFSLVTDSISVVVSPHGKAMIQQSLKEYKFLPELLIQTIPRGMGDAVLKFKTSSKFDKTNNLILVWGDIPFIQISTLMNLLKIHEKKENDFTFPTRFVDSAYTIVSRDKNNNLVEVIETKELGIDQPKPGERDMGLFVFKKDIIFKELQRDSKFKFGNISGEHGFLYIIRELIFKGYKVEGLPIAAEKDLISLNYLKDVEEYES